MIKRLISSPTIVYPLVLVCIVLTLLLPRLNQPFWGHHEFNGAFYGTIARNYLRYPLKETKGAQITTPYRVSQENWSLHTHHPFTYPYVLSLWLAFWGVTEASARLLSIVASSVGVLGLFFLNRQLTKSSLVSFLGVIGVCLTPLFLYYGRLPVFEPLLLPLVSWGLWSYVVNRHQKTDYLTAVFIGASFLLDWPGFWLGFWLLIAELLTTRRWSTMIVYCISIGVNGGLILLHQWVVTGTIISEFLDVGIFRLAVSEQPYTTIQWIQTLVSRTKAFLGLPLLLVASMGMFGRLLKNRSLSSTMLVISLAIGLSHIVVFRNITWYHDYMLYHLIPFLSIALAVSFSLIQKKWGNWPTTLVACGMITLTVLQTHQFYIALRNLVPHRVCVEFGRQVAVSESQLTFVGTKEEVNTCPPFIGYYGGKRFERRVKNN